MAKDTKKYTRKAVTYRLATAQLERLENAAKATHETKTELVEKAIGIYLNQLHLMDVI